MKLKRLANLAKDIRNLEYCKALSNFAEQAMVFVGAVCTLGFAHCWFWGYVAAENFLYCAIISTLLYIALVLIEDVFDFIFQTTKNQFYGLIFDHILGDKEYKK